MTVLNSVTGALVLYKPRRFPGKFTRSTLEKQTTEAMRRSLESAIYFVDHCMLLGKGKIFCLIGTSTAGKTSIIQQLKKDDLQWMELGSDLEGELYIADMLRILMRPHYDEIVQAIDHNNISKAVFCDQVIFKENIPSQTVEKAKEALKKVNEVKAESKAPAINIF